MNDIVDKLRDYAIRYANDYGYGVATDLNAAADEIDRLRAVLRKCMPGASAVDLGGEMIGLYLIDGKPFSEVKKEIRDVK